METWMTILTILIVLFFLAILAWFVYKDYKTKGFVKYTTNIIFKNYNKKISNLIKTRTTITLVIQKPIYPNRLLGKKDAILDLKERVRNSMCEELEQDA